MLSLKKLAREPGLATTPLLRFSKGLTSKVSESLDPGIVAGIFGTVSSRSLTTRMVDPVTSRCRMGGGLGKTGGGLGSGGRSVLSAGTAGLLGLALGTGGRSELIRESRIFDEDLLARDESGYHML